MSAPANLYPGLNDIADVLEEYPIETSRYLTLLHEIDAKCVHSMPQLNDKIDNFLSDSVSTTNLETSEFRTKKLTSLNDINGLFEELMPSLEEKMHVSSIMLESLQALNERLELAYEVTIRNQEIPTKLRLGIDNHPAMHLHHELMDKIENKNSAKSTQALRSESRREAMAANRRGNQQQPQQELESVFEDEVSVRNLLESVRSNKRITPNEVNVDVNADMKRRKRKNVAEETKRTATIISTIPLSTAPIPQDILNRSKTNEYGEPLYCYCNQVAYGEMVGCDGEHCELEWFHLPCIGLETLPKGKWYCKDCQRKMKLE